MIDESERALAEDGEIERGGWFLHPQIGVHPHPPESTAEAHQQCESLIVKRAGAEWPDGMEMIRHVREALGLFAGAMPISPRQAWEEALDAIRRLR